MTNKEIWKPVKDYEGLYEVSDRGRIRSLDKITIRTDKKIHPFKGKILKSSIMNTGYSIIILTKNKKKKSHLLHRLIAQSFIPNINNERCINHKDMNKQNNDVSNLEWCSYQYNHIHSFQHSNKRLGENHWNSKLNKDNVREIKNNLDKSNKELGEKFNVSQATIYDIRMKRTWKE